MKHQKYPTAPDTIGITVETKSDNGYRMRSSDTLIETKSDTILQMKNDRFIEMKPNSCRPMIS